MRRDIARYAAPAAFLVAATVAILLVRAGLNAEETSEPPLPPPVTTPTETRATTAAAPPVRPPRYTRVERGETLGTIADEFGTTVESIVELNPGVDPSALQVGQRIRVR